MVVGPFYRRRERRSTRLISGADGGPTIHVSRDARPEGGIGEAFEVYTGPLSRECFTDERVKPLMGWSGGRADGPGCGRGACAAAVRTDGNSGRTVAPADDRRDREIESLVGCRCGTAWIAQLLSQRVVSQEEDGRACGRRVGGRAVRRTGGRMGGPAGL